MATVKLAKLDREKRPEPFSVELTDGTEVTFADPKRLAFSTLTELDGMNPFEQVRAITGDGFEALADDPEMDGEALELLMGLWQDHYGMTTPGEAASSSGS